MTTYHHLDWNSLNAVKNHLYRRLASPINNALGRLAIARHLENASDAEMQLIYAERNLERAMNLIRAWAALVHVKSGGTITPEQRRVVRAEDWPEWLIEYLNTQTGLQLEHTAPVYVHPETFFESILLLWRSGAAIGALKQITTSNAKDDSKSVWLRAIFEPPPTGPYTSLKSLAESLNAQLQYDTLIQIMVLQDLFTINQSTLKIQNNKQTNEQALAVCLPVVPEGMPLEIEDTDELFATVPDRLPATDDVTADEMSERESFFAQVIRELNSAVEDLDAILEEEDPLPLDVIPYPDPADSGESETLIVPPPSLRERLAAVEELKKDAAQTQRDTEANARSAAGHNGSPDHTNRLPETRILPPPGFRERLEAVTRLQQEIEIVTEDDTADTDIVLPPQVERRFNERRVNRDTQTSKTANAINGGESAESTETDDVLPHEASQPHAGEDDTPHESGEG